MIRWGEIFKGFGDGDGVAFVQVSPTVLIALKLWGDDPPPDPYDPSMLNGLTAVAVAKAAAVLG